MKKPVVRFVKIKGGYRHKETLLTTLTGQDAKKLEKHMDEYG